MDGEKYKEQIKFCLEVLSMVKISGEILDCYNCRENDLTSWFCVQTHSKQEHIAAGFLGKVGRIEVFNPQMRIRRATTRGAVWFTESAYPGYIFARFHLPTQLDTVRYSSGVTKVVQFNGVYPSVPDYQMDQLRSVFGERQMLVMTPRVSIGDTVRIQNGAFHDLLAVVEFVHPAKQRVRALLEFLGRMTSVELDADNLKVEFCNQTANHPLYCA